MRKDVETSEEGEARGEEGGEEMIIEDAVEGGLGRSDEARVGTSGLMGGVGRSI